jgi:hypothetical protein
MSRNLLNINDTNNYAECIQSVKNNTQQNTNNNSSSLNNSLSSLNITNNSNNPIGIELKNGNSNTWGIKTSQNKLYIRNENDKDKNVITINNNGNIGIKNTTPINTIDISGSVVIGADYASKITAPQNGLMVQGNTILSNLIINNLKINNINNISGSYLLNYNPTNGHVNFQPNGIISDKRHKTNISDADTKKFLDIVNSIKSREFEYIDEIINKNKWGVGVIADEINEIEFFKNNELIGYQSGYVPNIYKLCNVIFIKNIMNNWDIIKIFLDNTIYNLKINDSIIYIYNNYVYHAEIISSTNYYIAIKNNYIENKLHISKLFIYGCRVNNIKYIKNDCLIWTLIPAIQELSKENNNLINKNNELEERLKNAELKIDVLNKSNQTKIEQLNQKIQFFDEQLQKLLAVLDITG